MMKPTARADRPHFSPFARMAGEGVRLDSHTKQHMFVRFVAFCGD